MARTVVADLKDVPEALRGEYIAQGDKFVLKLEGDDPPGYVKEEEHVKLKGKVNELRNTNVDLLKKTDELDKLRQRFDGIDPEEHRKMKAKLAETGITDPAQLESRFQSMVKEAIAPIQEKLTAAEKRATEKEAKLNDEKFGRVIAEVAAKLGAKPSAIKFLTQEARSAFVIEDGEIKAKADQLGPKGDPLTPEDWMVKATKDYDYAFEKSGGGGSGGTRENGQTGGLRGNVLLNPSPQELGRHAKDITAGKVKPQHTS